MTQKNLYIKITHNIGAGDLVKENIGNKYELIDLMKKGLYKRNLLRLAKEMALPLREFVLLLPTSERTVRRYRSTKRLSSDLTERIIKLGELYTKGVDVFGNREKFLHWLNADSKVLRGKPFRLLDTITGINFVIEELDRIEFGVYV